MENQPQPTEKYSEKGFIPLENARFTDRLEPQYEEQWVELVEGAESAKVTVDAFAFSIWNNESFPAAIRDRAMLKLIGKQSSVDKWKGPWNMGYMFTGFSLGLIQDKAPEFKQWFEEALAYGDIISDHVLFKMSYVFFTDGQWSQDRFEGTLEKIDSTKVQPTFLKSWDDYELDPDRLPYIDDILNDVTVDKSNEKMKEWARQKYDLFVENFFTNEKVLPKWLQKLPHRTIYKFVKGIYPRFENDETLPLNIIAVYNNYLLGLHNGLYLEQFNHNGSSIIKHLGEFPSRTVAQYLKCRYECAIYRFGELSRDEEQTIKSYLGDEKFSDETLLRLADQLDKKRAEENKEHAEWLAKEKEDRKRREEQRKIEKMNEFKAKERYDRAKQQYQDAFNTIRGLNP